MTEEDQLKRMVMTFRVAELHMLLGFAGKNKTGRKNELQSRALEIVKLKSPNIHQRIRDLYKSIQLEMTLGDRSQTAGGVNPNNILSTTRGSAAANPVPTAYNQSAYGNRSNSATYGGRSSGNQSHGSLSNSTYSDQTSRGSFPINPDVKMKKLPFYDILAELLKPCTLPPHGSGRYQEASFPFALTPQQANKIAHSRDLRPGKQDYLVQVQLRFCLLETTCEQEDNFPPNITLKVNDKLCSLPSPIPTNKTGAEPKRPSRPVNITGICKFSPTVSNKILVTWSADYGRCYVISGYLVQKLTSEDLLSRLKAKGPRLADFTKSLIKQKMREDSECEIATTSLRCSLLCPLGKMRMVLPCRAETCNHLQCFDASLFLQMNERKPTWTCPVCDKPAVYDNLVIDGYFQDVLETNSSCSEVTLCQDGSWSPLVPKKEPKEEVTERKKSEVAIETLDDSDDEVSKKNESVIGEVKGKRKTVDVECITLTDSEDESPPVKKLAQSKGDADWPSKTKSYQSLDETSGENSEASNTNESWHVGEVDHGKRLVFRKDPPSTNNGNMTPNYPGSTPSSSGSASPQVICLDSPMPSPSPPSSTGRNQCTTPAPLTAAAPITEPPPYVNPIYPYDSLTSNASMTGSPNPTVPIIPVCSEPLVVDPITSPYLMTDPFTSSFLPPTIGNPFAPTYSSSDLSENLSQLFNPVSMNLSGQPSTDVNENTTRSPDHHF